MGIINELLGLDEDIRKMKLKKVDDCMSFIRCLFGWSDLDYENSEMKEKTTKRLSIEEELKRDYENGLINHFEWLNEMEATLEAAKLIGVFTSKRAELYQKKIAMFSGGQYVGAIQDEEIKSKLDRLYRRCFSGYIILNPEDKDFIKNAIEGGYFKPFYE